MSMKGEDSQKGAIKLKVDFYNDVLIKGLKNGLNVTWMLTKVLVPVYFIITFLNVTPVVCWISKGMTPLMEFMGLPGQASIPLVVGNLLGVFAGIGAIKAIGFNVREITILAVMLSFSHALPIETAVTRRIGVKSAPVIFTRIGLAVVSGIVLNLVL